MAKSRIPKSPVAPEFSERQRNAAKARWNQTPKNERSAEMSRVVQVRWAKYRQQQQKKKAKQTASPSSSAEQGAAA